MDNKKREEIREESKKLLDKFSKALKEVKVATQKGTSESNVLRDRDLREEGVPPGMSSEEGKVCDDYFREVMFENAPQKSKDFIIAEKKSW